MNKVLTYIIGFVILIIPLGIAAILHEIAHGYAAYLLGDRTAKEAGRLTLNPFKHIDLFGTIIFPVLLRLAGFLPIILFKPVPIDPSNFKEPVKDSMKVALAGPLTNFLLAFLTILLTRLFINIESVHNSTFYAVYYNFFAEPFIIINLILGIFNLIPFPPLDGHWILYGFLSPKYRFYFRKYKTYLSIFFLFLLLTGKINLFLREILQFFYKILNFLLYL